MLIVLRLKVYLGLANYQDLRRGFWNTTEIGSKITNMEGQLYSIRATWRGLVITKPLLSSGV